MFVNAIAVKLYKANVNKSNKVSIYSLYAYLFMQFCFVVFWFYREQSFSPRKLTKSKICWPFAFGSILSKGLHLPKKMIKTHGQVNSKSIHSLCHVCHVTYLSCYKAYWQYHYQTHDKRWKRPRRWTFEWMFRVRIDVSRLKTPTSQWPYVQSIGQNLQLALHFTTVTSTYELKILEIDNKKKQTDKQASIYSSIN